MVDPVKISHLHRGTVDRGLMRGLATFPQSCIQEPLVVRDRDRRPQKDLWLCTASAHLLEDLGRSRSVEADFLSVLSINPRIFLSMFICIVFY